MCISDSLNWCWGVSMHKGMYSKSTGNFVRQKGLLDPRACAAATERDENCKFSRSSLEILTEIEKFSNDCFDSNPWPYRKLGQFHARHYNVFDEEAFNYGDYKGLVHGCAVRFEPFDTVPGIAIFRRHCPRANCCTFFGLCYLPELGPEGIFNNPLNLIEIFCSSIDFALPRSEVVIQPDVTFRVRGQDSPHLLVGINWKNDETHGDADTRRKIQGSIIGFEGQVKTGIVMTLLKREGRKTIRGLSFTRRRVIKGTHNV